MSTLGPAVAAVLTGAVAAVLERRRRRPPRWLRPGTTAAEGYAALRAELQARRGTQITEGDANMHGEG